jgi:hypothetical protein
VVEPPANSAYPNTRQASPAAPSAALRTVNRRELCGEVSLADRRSFMLKGYTACYSRARRAQVPEPKADRSIIARASWSACCLA